MWCEIISDGNQIESRIEIQKQRLFVLLKFICFIVEKKVWALQSIDLNYEQSENAPKHVFSF